MRLFFLSLLALIFFQFPAGTLSGQTPDHTVDTDTTAYFTADTARAFALLKEAEALISKAAYSDALEKLSVSRDILETTLGAESLEVSNVLQTMGRCFGRLARYDTAIVLLNRMMVIREKQLPAGDLLLAQGYLSLGFYLAKINELDSTIVLYKKALKLIQDEQGEASKNAAVLLNNIGNTYIQKGDLQEAENYHERALKIRLEVLPEGDREIGQSYQNLAIIKKEEGDINGALELLQKALPIYRDKLGDKHPAVADLYNNLGNALHGLFQLDSALMYQNKALEIQIAVFGEIHPNVAASYTNLGTIYVDMLDFPEAIHCYEKAAEIFRQVNGDRHPVLASPYENLGNWYRIKGDIKKAIFFHEKAIELQIQNGEEWHSYHNIGGDYLLIGHYEKAVWFLKEALHILESQAKPRKRNLALIKVDLSGALGEIGKTDEALAFLEEARSLYRELTTLADDERVNIYEKLGTTYSKLEQVDTAVYYYQEALKIADRDPNLLSRSIILLKNLGNRWTDLGMIDSARWAYDRALSTSLDIFGPNHQKTIQVYHAMSTFYRKQGRYDEAMAMAEAALHANRFNSATSLEKIISRPLLIQSLALKGKALKNRFDRNADASDLKTALTVFSDLKEVANQHMRSIDLEKKSMEFLAQNLQSAYEDQLGVLMQMASDPTRKNEAAMFEVTERSKSLMLFKAIQESAALHYAGIPDSLLDQEYNTRVDITYYEKKLQEKLEKGLSPSDEEVLALGSRLFDLNQKYESLKTLFEEQYPDYHELKYKLNTASVEQVQTELLQKDQALLEYFVGDSSLFIFLIKKDDFLVQEIPLDFPLRAWMQQLRDNISQPHPFNLELYADAAYKLYGKLIAPLPDDLPEKLIIIPDGLLGYLPFEALLTEPPTDVYAAEGLPYLLHKHQITYCYSATLLQQMQRKTHRQEPTRMLLAMAPYAEIDSVLTTHLYEGDLLASLVRSDTLTALPGTRAELDSLQQIFPTDAFYGDEATEERFLDRAGSYRMLHLSTHGMADARTGDYSYLAFFPLPDSLENELLFVRELYNVSLNADLVVLSACETATGELRRGEGIISLARAFAYAGAKSIATTLWQVNDQSMQTLMVDFYHYLRQGLSKDAALRQAKLDYLKANTGMQAGPYHWAPVIFVGDGKAIE